MSTPDLKALYELEASVIGAIINDSTALAQFPMLEMDDFAHGRHRAIFGAIRNLESANRPVDVVTIEAQLASDRVNIDIADLGMLMARMPTLENAIEYVRQIRDAAIGRRVRIGLSDVLSKADALSGSELVSVAMAVLAQISGDQPDDTMTISELIKRRFAQLEFIAQERAAGRLAITGYPTGVEPLDAVLGGWQPGIASIVCARPGAGKSSLGLATADACSAAGHGAHVFSLEDSEAAYTDRTLARGSGVAAETIRSVSYNNGQLAAISRAATSHRKRQWLFDGRSGITADEVVRSVRRHAKRNNTRVVLVDYVTLIKAMRRNNRMSKHEAIDETITCLADAAKQDKLAYVVMAQLNRECEKRQDKRPQLSDLKESGSLEERAKCVVGLYRGSMYGDSVQGIDWDPQWESQRVPPTTEEHKAQVQLLVLKNSNGRTGRVLAKWHGPTTTIS